LNIQTRLQPPIDLTKKRQERLVLDTFTVQDIRQWKTRETVLSDFAKEIGEHFERERAKKLPALVESLQNKGRSLSGVDWGRCVKYMYSDSPLSAWGSAKSVPGGRFNFGDIAPKYTPFAALYVAEDFTTAFKEKRGNYVGGKAPCASLDLDDLTLSRKESHAWILLRISLTNVLDIRDQESIEDFASILQKIKMPRHLRQKAISLKLKPPSVVDTPEKLSKALHDPVWRNTPTRVDVASNSQIFGAIAKAAGIQAILYSSRFTGKSCLAIFPELLADSDDFVEVIDPPVSLLFNRLDSLEYQKALQNPQSLRKA
jgi:RES domain